MTAVRIRVWQIAAFVCWCGLGFAVAAIAASR